MWCGSYPYEDSANVSRRKWICHGFSPVPGKLVPQILCGTFVDPSELLAANFVTSEPEPLLMLDGRLALTTPPKKRLRQIEDIAS